jgi:cobalt-zinc-cadmium efflux system membrane fusion protein
LTGEDLERGNLSREGLLQIRAPIAGTIIAKHAAINELAGPGAEVMVLADLSVLWVWADVYERDLEPILETRSRGEVSVEIFVNSFPGRAFKGELDYVGATMDEATRTVKVRAAVDNGEELLRPGMFCEVRMSLASTEAILTVPKAAVLSDEGRDFVFKHLKDEYYVRRAVKKGREFDESVEIVEGLEPGELIVVEGAFLLKSDVLRSKMGAGCAD